MIQIEHRNIAKLANEFLKKVDPAKRRRGVSRLHKFFIKNIVAIVTCPVSEFENWELKFNKIRANKAERKNFKGYMRNQYTAVIDKHGQWLAEQLNVRVCPYCNRQYTFTVEQNSSKIRPQFDHYYNKDEHPWFAISFYNLIPCCPTCNHKKSTRAIRIHPYSDSFREDCKFVIDKIGNCILGGDMKKWNVQLSNNDSRYTQHNDAFLLTALYNEHKDYVSEMVHKARAYHDSYYETLKDTFRSQGLSKQEMNILIFGNYIDPGDFRLRPLSKLTKDILDQIGVKL